MALRVNVLGPVSAEVDGVEAALGGPRQRAVLAVLVAARGQVVSAERIVTALWGDDTPSMTTLHSYIARLRQALEPGRAAKAQSDVLPREGVGYALRVDLDEVDAERFARLSGEGEQLVQDDPAAAVTVLAEALELWRGQPYADFADAPFAAPEVARLEGLRLATQENLFAARLALGRHAAVVGDLEKHTAEHPMSERGWELLVLALYRAGRQGDALAALRSARKVLAEELGIDPGLALRELEAAVLSQDGGLLPQPAPRIGAVRNLPFPVTRLVGRATELLQVTALLADHRLVTLTGPGGIGKTRLALEAARACRDIGEPWLVELAGLTEPALLAGTIAQALGISGASTTRRVTEALRDRRLLLVLDNCEHLVDAVHETVTELLAHTIELRVLATSRETLGAIGEAVYEVPPLSAMQATELFVSRATATVPGWKPTPPELETTVRLCGELDGLPLAIELAAAQCRVLSVDQILAALDDRFAVLTSGPGPQRHRTLLRTVEWSHRLLEPEERRLFNRLSVFAAGFDLDAAAAVCDGPVLAGLSALVRKSLVTVEAGTAPRRYRLLETLKDFARTRQDPVELGGTQAAHRAWVLARAEAAEARLRGHQAVPAIGLLITDQPEHRAAFTTALLAGDSEYALRLSGALSWFWYRRGHVTEGLGWLTTAMELTPDAPPGLQARALIGMAGLHYLAGNLPAAHRAAKDAAEAARTAGNLQSEGQGLTYRALFGGLCGAPTAVADARAALDLSRLTGLTWLEAEALMVIGMLLLFGGEVAEACETLTESITVATHCGHRFVQASSTWLLVKTDLKLGLAEQALAAGVPMLRLLDDDGDLTSWLVIAHTLAAALTQTERPEDGARLLGAVQAIGARVGFSPLEMDPADAPQQTEQVRQALPPEVFADCLRQGAALSQSHAYTLLNRLVSGQVHQHRV
ncbi:Predicted ATPase [Streptosporangium subroseum]|uniref:Predicted ATPase n=1 Tax=Streptosporangium subroseum TaxID=106412 RepID=A0A239P4Z4_9ACTN|nr:BTAD domain-containing putative transcriptional regulator [Streptosporangium subroseum]SNT62146.1 Predicted ATPase [Streptosporangium subroseum]